MCVIDDSEDAEAEFRQRAKECRDSNPEQSYRLLSAAELLKARRELKPPAKSGPPADASTEEVFAYHYGHLVGVA